MSSVYSKYFNPEAIQLAFFRVKATPNKMAKDVVGIRAFESELEENCEYMSEKILSGQFQPSRGFKYFMPKASKTSRTITVLNIEDAIVYQAIVNKIAERNYKKLSDYNSFVFGSVLSPEVTKGVKLLKEEEPLPFFFLHWKNLYKQFAESIIQAIEVDKVKYKFETDITGFFDSIPHYNLLLCLSEQFGVEDEILDLLESCLNIWSGTKHSPTPGVGIPQGASASFLFANLLLHNLDKELIEQGCRYYRYMDDISIFGYEENELLQTLQIIDNYTKANALSINSKKTTIEKIEGKEEDETVKTMKKALSFSSYEDDLDGEIPLDEKERPVTPNDKLEELKREISKKVKKLSNQDSEADSTITLGVETITNKDDLIEFWTGSIVDVKKELGDVFNESNELIKEGFTDQDAIRLSATYGTALRELKYLEYEIEPHDELLDYWLFFFNKFFWRANILSYTLMQYKSERIKPGLLEFQNSMLFMFEWSRYHVYQIISLTQSFNEQELRRQFFPLLRNEQDDLPKLALYRLLYKHAKTKQFRSTITHQLNKEKSVYIKKVISDFNKYHQEDLELDEFLKSIGI